MSNYKQSEIFAVMQFESKGTIPTYAFQNIPVILDLPEGDPDLQLADALLIRTTPKTEVANA